MSQSFNLPTRSKYLFLVLTLISAAIFVGDHVNDKFNMNDFRVMYYAADAYLNGEPVYGAPFGLDTGYYKYSPFTLLYFILFTPLTFYQASVVHYVSIGLATFFSLVVIERIVFQTFFAHKRSGFRYLLATVFTVLVHLHREIHLGNINMLIVLMLALCIFYTLKNKYTLAGVLLAIVIFAKPYFVICLLPFLLFRRFRIINATIISGILFLVVSLLIFGFDHGIDLYFSWFEAMMSHNSYLRSSHTLISLFNMVFGTSFSHQYSFHLLLVLAVTIYLIMEWKRKKLIRQQNPTFTESEILMMYFFFSMAIIPNILITDTEHFLFSLPLILFVLVHFNENIQPIHRVGLILVCILYAGNFSDVIGIELSRLINGIGLLGISNLLFIAMALLITLKYIKGKRPPLQLD
ncbi:MAG: glycosyltransferase family 87 protein [Bacteroidota bacterium]